MAQTNKDKFISAFRVLNTAAVGVAVVKTREPFRAFDALHEWCYGNRTELRMWSMINGWNLYSKTDHQEKPKTDGVKEVATAVAKIDGHDGSAGFGQGVFVLMWPHFMLPKIPALMQMLAELARSCAECNKRVVLIVPNSFDVPPELQDCVTALDFELPNRQELLDSYARVISGIANEAKRPNYPQREVDMIMNAVIGMTEMEAEGAIARAVATNEGRLPRVPIDEFIGTLLAIKTEVVKRSDVLELMPVEKMENVGGLGALKQWVTARKGAFTEAAREAGVDRPKGMLLAGPPGTAKSLAAKATAHALGQPLIRFDLSRVYAGIVGQSEGRVREALKTLEAMAPAVILVDEVDKATGVRSGTNDGGVSSRVFGAILTHMQESKSGNFWVLTANRTDNLPSELVRKGRLDEIWSVSTPNEEERMEILRIHLRLRKTDPDTVEDLQEAVIASAGYVGAEIEAAVAEAKLQAFNAGQGITGATIVEQFAKTKPLSVAFADDFNAMKTWAENNARPASMYASVGQSSSSGPSVRQRQRRIETSTLDS